MSDSQGAGHKMPHIGLRKLKSLLAIFIGFWLWQLVRVFVPALEVHPLFIYIYGLLEIRATSEKTVTLGKNRIRATFTAVGVGLPMIALQEILLVLLGNPWWSAGIELGAILAGVLLTLLIAEKVGCADLCGLAAATVVILMVSHDDQGVFLYSVLRVLQTIAGVFIAWLINVKLFPYPGKKPAEGC